MEVPPNQTRGSFGAGLEGRPYTRVGYDYGVATRLARVPSTKSRMSSAKANTRACELSDG